MSKQDFGQVKHAFLIVVSRQIREVATLIIECSLMNTLRIAEVIVRDSRPLEY